MITKEQLEESIDKYKLVKKLGIIEKDITEVAIIDLLGILLNYIIIMIVLIISFL